MNTYNKILFGMAAVVFVASVGHASAATKKAEKLINDQFSVSVNLSDSAIVEGKTTTFAVEVINKSKNQKGVVDVELFNDKDERVTQDYFSNVKLNKGKKASFKVTTASNLPPGVYHFGVGVFGQNWKEPHAWYHQMPNFVVVAK